MFKYLYLALSTSKLGNFPFLYNSPVPAVATAAVFQKENNALWNVKAAAATSY